MTTQRARRPLAVALALATCVSVAGFALAADPATGAGVHVVTIDAFEFKPAKLTVKAGDTVEWRNADPVPHTATSTSGGFDSGSIAAGASWRFVATKKGRFGYVCTFHPIMKGEIVVE